MSKHADLDVILRWSASADGFDVTMLYNAPGEIEDYPYFGDQPLVIDMAALTSLRDDIDAYGSLLGELLFSGQARVVLDKAMTASEAMPLHLRLKVDSQAPLGYQGIRWETIRRPGSGERLATKANVRFSRLLGETEGRQPTPLARTGEMKALIAVANPADIGDYAVGALQLTAIDVAQEVDRARSILRTMTTAVLPHDAVRVTRRAILDALHQGVNVLYLICHGELTDHGPQVFLEDDYGNVAVVNGADLAGNFADLERVPTITVLCSCQSGGRETFAGSTAESLTALGPAVARAGSSVVIAMQGDVRISTATTFLSSFFEELEQDGIPARAMAVARSKISDTPDWYVPVLYSRLKRGSAWYLPRFGGREAVLFPNLQARITEQHCTPIIGSGVAGEDGVLPTRQQLAGWWADRRQMPVSEFSRSDLASVAQYVSVDGGGSGGLPRDELARFLRLRLRAAHREALPDLDWETAKLQELVRSVGEWKRRQAGGTDCYSRLARMSTPVYVTTSWTSLLEDALVEAGKTPVVRHFDWYEGRQHDIGDDDAGPEFPPEAPLVYHLFGTLESPRSLVLTEDDYFTWLRAWTKQVDKGPSIPHYVKPPLTENALLFLGYVFDDWEFRMSFQAIKAFAGIRLAENNHVGVQLEPETLRIERESAQEYLEGYFGPDNIAIYWATSGKFLEELAAAAERPELP